MTMNITVFCDVTVCTRSLTVWCEGFGGKVASFFRASDNRRESCHGSKELVADLSVRNIRCGVRPLLLGSVVDKVTLFLDFYLLVSFCQPVILVYSSVNDAIISVIDRVFKCLEIYGR